MNILNSKIDKHSIFYIVAFIILALSYSGNIWKIAPAEEFYTLDKYDEGYIIGRLARSEKDGIFSYGGLTGINLHSKQESGKTITSNSIDTIAPLNYLYKKQLSYYFNDEPIPEIFHTYRSQPGGQAVIYSLIQKIIPFDQAIKLKILVAINASLSALCFVLFLAWARRNLNLTSSIVAFFLILCSQWITNFAHNLWWSLWSFYLPFLGTLLFMEERHHNPQKYTNTKLFLVVFAVVFIKGFITGFEFVTTSLLAAFCPIVYYSILEKQKIKDFIKTSLSTSTSMVIAIIATMLVLITQLKSLLGTFNDGINHIIYSFFKRTTFDEGETTVIPSLRSVLATYHGDYAFKFGFLPKIFFQFKFFVIILCLCSLIILYINRKMNQQRNIALITTSFFAILCPLSWFIIFKQHAYIHTFLDFIVWYIPFLLYVFLIIGQSMHLAINRFLKKGKGCATLGNKE